jgi:F-type H+-transporting ATPase subunit b
MEIIEALGIRFPLVIAHIIAFLAVMAVFKLFLFDPVRAHMHDREKRIADDRRAAIAAEAEVSGKQQALTERRAEIQREAYERTQALVREGVGKKNEVLVAAREQAYGTIDRARNQVSQERSVALAKLEDDMVSLGLEVITQVTAADFDAKACENAVREAALDELKKRTAA